jgi:hypothetical protein
MINTWLLNEADCIDGGKMTNVAPLAMTYCLKFTKKGITFEFNPSLPRHLGWGFSFKVRVRE